MLVAKISFYFESAKKTGEKFQKKLGFQKHCTPPMSSTEQTSGYDQGAIRHLFIVAYRPLSFPREVLGTILKKNPPSRLRKQDGRFSII